MLAACAPASHGAVNRVTRDGRRAADISVFELRDGHWALPDAAGATEVVEQLLIPRMVVRAGEFTELGAAAIAGDPASGAGVAGQGIGG